MLVLSTTATASSSSVVEMDDVGVEGDNGEIMDNNGGGGDDNDDDDDDDARANTAGENEAWLRVEPIPIIARRTTAFFPFPFHFHFVIAIAPSVVAFPVDIDTMYGEDDGPHAAI